MRVYLTANHNVSNYESAVGVKHDKYPDGVDLQQEAIVLRDLITKYLMSNRVQVFNEDTSAKLPRLLEWLRNITKPQDWCIDINFNAGMTTSSGCECVIADKHNVRERDMARAICKAINDAANIRIREYKYGRAGVVLECEKLGANIKQLRTPAVANNVMVNVCFMTFKKDANKFFDNRNEIAEAIADSIILNF